MARHAPTSETRGAVQTMAAYGLRQDEIARSIGISKPTLEKHYRQELDTAATQANARVGQFLYRTASGQALKDGTGATYADCTRAAMFWAKTRMGWRETNTVELQGKDGGPVQIEGAAADAAAFARSMARLAASAAGGTDEAPDAGSAGGAAVDVAGLVGEA